MYGVCTCGKLQETHSAVLATAVFKGYQYEAISSRNHFMQWLEMRNGSQCNAPVVGSQRDHPMKWVGFRSLKDRWKGLCDGIQWHHKATVHD